MSLVREVRFAQAFSFKYSARPGTPAAGMRKQVAEAVKAERLQMLQALLEAQAQSFNAEMVGRTLMVLIEGDGRHPGQRVGRSPYLQPVHVMGSALAVGELVPVRITTFHPHSLSGEVARELEPGGIAA